MSLSATENCSLVKPSPGAGDKALVFSQICEPHKFWCQAAARLCHHAKQATNDAYDAWQTVCCQKANAEPKLFHVEANVLTVMNFRQAYMMQGKVILIAHTMKRVSSASDVLLKNSLASLPANLQQQH